MGAMWAANGAEVRAGTVQVWQLQVEEAGALLGEAYAVLAGDERARAARMRAGLPRDEFVAARGALRMLVGNALGVAADAVLFETGAQGKPAVVGGGIEFNVAHARGLVLVALSRDGAVGVDVEPVDREVEALELARTHFHPAEVAWVAREGSEAFFRCWTRKEAVVKADSRGLQLPLAGFCVVGEEVKIEVAVAGGATVWVQDLGLGAGFCGAVALPKRETLVEVRLF